MNSLDKDESGTIFLTLERLKTGEIIQVPGFPFLLGRKADAKSAEGDMYHGLEGCPTISRHHVKFIWEESRVCVVDQGSRNGTSLNGNSLVPFVPAAIRNGDILTLSNKEIFVVSLSVS